MKQMDHTQIFTCQKKTSDPQKLTLSQMFDMAGSGYDGPHIQCVDDNNDALIFRDGNLVCGTLEALIQHLIPTRDYYPDRTYVFAFLLGSRLFIKPQVLFSQVCQMCVCQQNLVSDRAKKESLGRFGHHLLRLLNHWTDLFPYDFLDELMMKTLKDISHRIVNIFPDLRKDVTNMMHNLLNRLSCLQVFEDYISKVNTESLQKSQNQIIPTTDIIEICPNPLILAQQLTNIEIDRFSHIGVEEFICACSEDRDNNGNCNSNKMVSNLESYVQWFNRLSYLVATEICSHLKKKNRVRMIEYFIDVAKECINIGNFNSLMAIIAGMNMCPVARLRKTWAKVNKAKFSILEHQMDPSNNFSSYRSCLKAAIWRSEGAVDDRERVIIPFLSLFVKDVYFLNEGFTNRLPNGNINFEKFWLMAKQLAEFVSWQQVECPYEKNSNILSYILTTPVYSETPLLLASFECEAPETSYDKERHKQLADKGRHKQIRMQTGS